MAGYQLDSFYFKFKNLLFAEKDATLTVKSDAGRLHVSLNVDLGHVHSEPSFPHRDCHHRCRNGPSQQRRRQRCAEERAKGKELGENVNELEPAEKAKLCEYNTEPEKGDTKKHSDSATNPSENDIENENSDNLNCDTEPEKGDTEKQNYSATYLSEKETSSSKFYCDPCDFSSNWRNGLRIHLSRKHAKLEQLDGAVEDSDGYEDSINHYPKGGWLGSAYKTYLDAIEVIDDCDLDEESKGEEKRKVLELRKDSFLLLPFLISLHQ